MFQFLPEQLRSLRQDQTVVVPARHVGTETQNVERRRR